MRKLNISVQSYLLLEDRFFLDIYDGVNYTLEYSILAVSRGM